MLFIQRYYHSSQSRCSIATPPRFCLAHLRSYSSASPGAGTCPVVQPKFLMVHKTQLLPCDASKAHVCPLYLLVNPIIHLHFKADHIHCQNHAFEHNKTVTGLSWLTSLQQRLPTSSTSQTHCPSLAVFPLIHTCLWRSSAIIPLARAMLFGILAIVHNTLVLYNHRFLLSILSQLRNLAEQASDFASIVVLVISDLVTPRLRQTLSFVYCLF